MNSGQNQIKQSNSPKNLPVVNQKDYFNYNKKDENGNYIEPEDKPPVIFGANKTGSKMNFYT